MKKKFKKVLITGASRGIGKAMAINFAKKGADLCLLARDEELLSGLSSELENGSSKITYHKCDISNKAQMFDCIEYANNTMDGIDLAVLNAGVGNPDTFHDFNSDNLINIFNINVFGTVYAIEKLIPIMKKQGSGTIAAVSSMADSRGFPGSASYCSSKGALSLILESASNELKGSGIDIAGIRPGFIKTDMTAKNNFKMPFLMEPEKAAAIIVKKLEAGKRRISFPSIMAFATYLGRITPGPVFDFLASRTKVK